MAIQVLTTGRTLVKKIIVGVPLTKNVSTAASIDNLVGIDTNGKQTGDVLLYDSDAGGDYVTTSLVDLVRSYISAGGDLSYDSATGQFTIDVEEIYTAENFDSDFGLAIQTIDGSLVPNLDSSYNLGSPTKKWKDLYLSGNTIYLGDISLVDQAGSFAVKDSNGAAAPFSLEANNTNDLAEGGNNLYYTRTRFDSALADGLSTQQIRAYFDGGTGVTYDSSTGVFSIGQPVATTDDVTFNNVDVSGELVVQGNLTVQGTTTTINSTTVSINDKNIVLADSAVDAAAADGAGITINGADASLTYSAAADKFVFDKGVIAPNYQGVYLGFDSDLARNSTVQSIRGYFNAAGDLSYNSATGEFSFDVEEVYTKANFDSDFNDALDEASINGLGLSYNSVTNTISITNTGVTANTYGSATRIPVFSVNAQGQLTLATETSIASVESIDFDSASGNFNVMTTDGQSFNTVITLDPYTTSNLTEGDDLYYTRARFDSALGDTTSIQSIRSYLNAGGDMSYDANTGTFSINVEEIYTKANFDSDFNVSVDEAALNGDGLSYNSGTNTLSITATGVDSGTYGSTTQIPVFTVNDRGQIDSIGTVLVAGVSSTSYDSSNGQLTINTADGNSFVTTLHDSADHVSRARYAITSVDNGGDGSFTYNASTGVLTYTGPSAAEVRSHFSASGDLSYDSATGQFTFDVEAVYTKANFDSDFNVSLDEAALGGTGLTYNSGTNTLDITNTGVVAGEYGSATQIPIITVNAQGQVDSISEILVAGVTDFAFDSSNGQFTISTADGGSFTTVATLDPYTTTTLAEGDNLYYTTARADSDAKNSVSATDAGGDGSLVYNNGTGVFTYTGPSATETRAHFTAGTGVTITDGTVEIGQTVDSTSDVIFGKVTVDSANVGGINFNATPGTYSSVSGALYWDSDPQKGLSFTPTTNEGNSEVTINIGQESLIYVHNQTGETVSNGDIVYISGTAHGQHPKITKAKADAAVSGTVAMATMDMVDNAHGYVTRFGLVRDLNTGGLTAGADVYLSADSAGKFTTDNVTVDTGYPIHIGKIVRVDSSTGSILIDPFTEHFEYLRISDRLKVSGKLEADSASLLNVQFNTTLFDSHQPYSEGLLYYDNAHKTLNYNDDITGMVHEIGIQEHQRVWNDTGALIRKGQPLYFSGNYTSGVIDVPTVALADATDVNAYNAQGIAAQDIPHNSYGHCLIAGQLTEVNTTGLSNGSNFFVGLGPGRVQNASPTYPNFPMCLGWVVQSGDSNTGILLVNQQNHSVNSFRVRTSAHIGTDLQVDGNLTVLGTQTTVGQANVTQGAPFYRLNEGDAIGEVGTVFTGTGLDDAFFAGHFTGSSPQTYYVRIDGVGTGAGGVDTFEVALGNDSEFTSPVLTKQNITGSAQLIHSADNISVDFGTSTGHDSGDRWSGTASPINVDTGFFTNRNTGTSGVGYTHMGFFFDVSDEKWKVIDEYDSSPTGIINVTDSSLGILMASGFEGTLTGDVTGNASTASALSSGRNFSITGDVTASPISFDGTGNVALSAAITANSIVNADINSAAAIADTKLATISTAGKVQNAATTATSANTGSAIVARDVSGNFAAGMITASLTGTASNASNLNSQAPSYYLDYTNFTNVPTVVSTFVNDANYLDSTTVLSVIDATYIDGLVDSVDNATNAINATNLNNQAPSYYLDYTNFTNVPTNVTTFVNDANYLDSTTVQGVINSAYVNGLVDSVDNATNALISQQVRLTHLSGDFYEDWQYITFADSNGTGNYGLSVGLLKYNTYNNTLYATTFNSTNGRFENLYADKIFLGDLAGADPSESINFGNSQDAKLYYSGADNTFELELEADAQSFIITDNGVARYTFNKSTSNLVASTFTGNATNALKLDSQDGAYYLNYNNFTNTPTIPPLGVDSADVSAIITSDVDAAFINALTIDADTLNGNAGSYYLDYGNFTSTPTIPSLGNDYVDSAQVVNIVDSDYVTARVTIDADPAGTAVAMAIALG